METVVPPTEAEPELHLLTDWGDQTGGSRTKQAAIVSAVVHILVISGLAVMPASFLDGPERVEPVHRITPLVDPPLTEFTQKAPNQGQVTKQFDGADSAPRPRIRVPQGLPTPPPPEPRRAQTRPQPPPPKPVQPLPEPPKIDVSNELPKADLPPATLAGPPQPPQIQTEEKPKLALENVGPLAPPVPPNQRRVPIPDPMNAIRHPEGVPIPNDPGATARNGPQSPLTLPQLLSDPQGVDFSNYLRLVLDSVRRHWQAVMPESVRFGLRGDVALVFSITREGKVGKLVIASGSGSTALDRAAVVGVSASDPFPPLPTAFKGPEIRLQMNFAYNAPKLK